MITHDVLSAVVTRLTIAMMITITQLAWSLRFEEIFVLTHKFSLSNRENVVVARNRLLSRTQSLMLSSVDARCCQLGVHVCTLYAFCMHLVCTARMMNLSLNDRL
jgi:hypothetical protein